VSEDADPITVDTAVWVHKTPVLDVHTALEVLCIIKNIESCGDQVTLFNIPVVIV
jgi:hypothetical protein